MEGAQKGKESWEEGKKRRMRKEERGVTGRKIGREEFREGA